MRNNDKYKESLTLLNLGFLGLCNSGGGHIVPPLLQIQTNDPLIKIHTKGVIMLIGNVKLGLHANFYANWLTPSVFMTS